jgi:hypothetical protein
MNCVSTPALNRGRRRALLTAAPVVLSLVTAFAQNAPLDDMVRTEQRFAARALVVGWKQAFLEYFADSASGFDGEKVVPAKELFGKLPDPPKDLRLIWEPRYGDIAASGDVGYNWSRSPNQSNGERRTAAASHLCLGVETSDRRLVPCRHGHGRPHAGAGDVPSWRYARAADGHVRRAGDYRGSNEVAAGY